MLSTRIELELQLALMLLSERSHVSNEDSANLAFNLDSTKEFHPKQETLQLMCLYQQGKQGNLLHSSFL